MDRLVVAVAVFLGGYLPGYRAGGPTVSVSRIIESDADQGFRVITQNRDQGEAEPYAGFRPRSWDTVGRAQVAYLRPGVKDIGWIVSQLRANKPDVYYLNSLHSPWFTLLPLLAIKCHVLPRSPVLLAPRGEASMGALGLKAMKKAMWRPIIKWLIGRKVTWHLSSESEESDVVNWWGAVLPTCHRTVVQIDPAIPPRATASTGPPAGSLVIVFASRIDPMKGLDDAIRIVAALRVPVEFRVYGVVSDERYWEACQQLADGELGAGTMRYMGTYAPTASQGIFAAGSLFLFPTHGENFGHVVSEALSVGCPVVVTANTPWTEVVEAGGGHVMRDQQTTLGYLNSILDSGEAASMVMRETVRSAYESWYSHTACASSIFSGGE